MTDELLALLDRMRDNRDHALRRFNNAQDDAQDPPTPLDAARIEYNRGEHATSARFASELAAILSDESGRLAANSDRIRVKLYNRQETGQ